ncbi:MAG: thioesterase family protein [Desulfatirhabdiaceae bacterium]
MKNIFKIQINVRFRDIDSMGHVNNAVFFTYFEEGRKALFQKIHTDSNSSVFPFILAHISCDYIRPVTLDSQLSLEMWVKEIGVKSFGLSYKLISLSDKSIIYAKGESVQVCFDYRVNKSIAVSDGLKQKLIGYL